MLALALTLSILAANTEDVTLAAPGLGAVGVDEKTADFYTDFLAQKLVLEGGMKVTTRTEIEALLGFERQKQLLGCSTETSACLAELAGALGVEGLLTGTLAKLGSGYTVNIKVVAASDGRTLALGTEQAKDDDALQAMLSVMAKRLNHDVRRSLGREALRAVPQSPQGGDLAQAAWIPFGAGLVGGVVGAGLIVLPSKLSAQTAGGPSLDAAEQQRAEEQNQTLKTAGYIVTGVAAAALLTSGVIFLVGRHKKAQTPTPVVLLGPDGSALVGVSLVFP